MKILLELRPALAGHSGIPQETRLLFRGLAQLDGIQVDGLLQSSNQLLPSGLPTEAATLQQWSGDRRTASSRIAAALSPGDTARTRRLLRLVPASVAMITNSLRGRSQPITRFDPVGFENILWRALFAKTLPSDDFNAVTSAQYRVACLPWSAAHASGLLTRKFGAAVYQRLNTDGYDLMIAETPYPGRVSAPTRLVVRYHDAVPLLMPHTIANRGYHQASHYHALRRNVKDGAWFACVSEATRRDLLSIVPEVEPRAVTIPNMVSRHYFAADSSPAGILGVLHSRANPAIQAEAAVRARHVALADAPAASSRPAYLLMVSTLEPRKNHLTLLAAWEQLRTSNQPNLQLVLVGMLGWNNTAIVRALLPWVARGQAHVLADVPAEELRLLYRHAAATVCPSFGEGFGYSGVEAMRCSGVVVASDVPVHREIYDGAAEYFNPFSAEELAKALSRVIGATAQLRRVELVAKGAAVAARYLPENVLPQWQAFLDTLAPRA